MSQKCASACESTAIDDRYELQYSGKVNEVIPVLKYRSKRSGLRVIVAQVEGPLVNGYFCLGQWLIKAWSSLFDVAFSSFSCISSRTIHLSNQKRKI